MTAGDDVSSVDVFYNLHFFNHRRIQLNASIASQDQIVRWIIATPYLMRMLLLDDSEGGSDVLAVLLPEEADWVLQCKNPPVAAGQRLTDILALSKVDTMLKVRLFLVPYFDCHRLFESGVRPLSQCMMHQRPPNGALKKGKGPRSDLFVSVKDGGLNSASSIPSTIYNTILL